jgi:hypothetical protein
VNFLCGKRNSEREFEFRKIALRELSLRAL